MNASALLEKPFQPAFQDHLQCEFTARCCEDPARGALSRACTLARKTSPISSMTQLLPSLLLVQSPAQALGLTSSSWQTFPPGYSPTTPVPPAPATPPALAPPWCPSPLHSASKSCHFSFTWTCGCFPLSPAPTPAGLGPGTPSRSQGKNFLAGFCPCTHAHGLGEPSSLPAHTHLSAQVLNPQTCFVCDFTRVRSGLTTFTHLPVRWWGPSFLALAHKDLC